MCEWIFYYTCGWVEWLVSVSIIAILFFVVVAIIWVAYTILFTKYLSEGEVVEKYIEPERSWMHLMPISVGKIVVLIPYMFHDDKDWVLVVQKGDKQGTIYVTEETYMQTKIGQYYRASTQDSLEDDIDQQEVEEE